MRFFFLCHFEIYITKVFSRVRFLSTYSLSPTKKLIKISVARDKRFFFTKKKLNITVKKYIADFYLMANSSDSIVLKKTWFHAKKKNNNNKCQAAQVYNKKFFEFPSKNFIKKKKQENNKIMTLGIMQKKCVCVVFGASPLPRFLMRIKRE